MRQILTLALTAIIVYGCAANGDRNVPKPYSITEALEQRDYKDKLKGVRLYFGNQRHPRVAKSLGVRTTSQRSNAVGRESNESCARAFASGLLRLRSAALRMGGDAVINIKSNYNHQEVSSATSYQCAAGAVMSGVALKGTIVKLRK
jgi:uncharacterized protein YbjQ (UPF0145 family)